MTSLNKTIAVLCLVMLALSGIGWGIWQYGNSRATTQELGTVKEAVQEAVAERTEAVEADVLTEAQKRTTAQEIRTRGIAARKELGELDALDKAYNLGQGLGNRIPSDPSPEPLRVLNELIAEGNRLIESSR